MGLSSKQVSSDGLDWAQNLLLQNGGLEVPKPSQSRQQQQPPQQQQQQQSSPPLRCPRCDSSNTKFCYYNNYNQSQPRHFCKACRRHWTKGGTLRNVPVGGGRKNKRLKTGKTEQRSSSSATTDTNTAVLHQQHQQLPFEFPDKKNISDILYRALLQPPPSLPLNANYINESSTTTTTNSASTSTSSNNSNGSFVPSLRPLPPIPQFSSFTTMDSLIDNPCSSSFMENTQFYSNFASSAAAEDFLFDNSKETQLPPLNSQSWQLPTSSGFLDSSHWNWDDFSFFLPPDPKPPQDDSQHPLQGI